MHAIKAHDRLLGSIFEEFGGYVFKTIGDAFCVSFADPKDAVLAALRTQQALQHSEADGISRSVRIGILSGSAELVGDDYLGRPLNRVARLVSVCNGGQILASSGVVEGTSGCREFGWRDLGEHRLRDLLGPLRIFQPVAPGLAADFPPLQSLSLDKSNLPEQLTPFMSRTTDKEKCGALLGVRRLLTLVGPGGVGKTSLALQTATDRRFPDGAKVVELASVRDRESLIPTICQVVGVKHTDEKSPREALAGSLGKEKGAPVVVRAWTDSGRRVWVPRILGWAWTVFQLTRLPRRALSCRPRQRNLPRHACCLKRLCEVALGDDMKVLQVS